MPTHSVHPATLMKFMIFRQKSQCYKSRVNGYPLYNRSTSHCAEISFLKSLSKKEKLNTKHLSVWRYKFKQEHEHCVRNDSFNFENLKFAKSIPCKRCCNILLKELPNLIKIFCIDEINDNSIWLSLNRNDLKFLKKNGYKRTGDLIRENKKK